MTNGMYEMYVFDGKNGHFMTYEAVPCMRGILRLVDELSFNWLRPYDLIAIYHNNKLVYADFAD